jgi:hypothetical protein
VQNKKRIMKMKKIMIAAVVAIAAACVNAATVNWGNSKGSLYDGSSESAKITSGTAYLMYVTADYTQSNLVNAFNSADGNVEATVAAMTASGALAGTGVIGDNARVSGSSSTSLAGTDGTAYFVVFANDKMYVSITGDSIYDPVTQEADLTFGSISASSKLSMEAKDGYAGAGWYAVPEPTSGLLMLVGLAGLALRRRRA